MSRRIQFFSIILCIVLLFAACGKENGDTQTFTAASERFQVTAPASWKDASGQFNPGADLEIMDANESIFFMILSGDKSKYEGSLDDYLDSETKKIADSYSPMNLVTATAKIGEYTANEYSFDTTMQTLTAHMKIYIFESEHYFAKIYLWSLKSDMNKNQDAIKIILDSVSEPDVK